MGPPTSVGQELYPAVEAYSNYLDVAVRIAAGLRCKGAGPIEDFPKGSRGLAVSVASVPQTLDGGTRGYAAPMARPSAERFHPI